MKRLLAICLFLTGISLSAQNLVMNPSFENVNTNCSGFTGAGYLNLNNWYNPDLTDSCSTPDWFATCLSSFFPTHAPNSQMGNQAPRTGTAYAGFISSDATQAGYREYVEGELSSTLVAGQTYCVTFYYSLADNSTRSVNRLGVYFSNTKAQFGWNNCNSPAPLNFAPQLQMPTGVQYNDKTNWVQCQWNYVATGGEKYLTIGNFFTNANTTTSTMSGSQPFAYYFVDDISVTPGVCVSCNLSASISATTSVSCNGGNTGSATASVTGGSGSQTYQWLPSGGTGATASNLAAGTYTVNVVDGGCSTSQTVTISQPNAISVSTQTTTANCGQTNGSATAVGSGGTGALTYSWSTGANGATLSNVAGGSYTVTVTDANSCTKTSVVTIPSTTGPSANAVVTQSVSCSGGSNGAASVNISGGTPSYTVNWSNSMTGTSITNVPSNAYTYTVTDAAGCTTTGNVSIPHAPDIISNGSYNCGPGSASATVTATGGTPGFTYSWTPGGQTTSIVNGLANGAYTCTVTDANNCVRYVQLQVSCGTTGISTYANQLVTVFPNPTDGYVTVRSSEIPKSIELYTIAGELVYQTVPFDSEVQVDMRSLASGVYFIKVVYTGNNVQRIKLLKQ